MSKIPYLGMSTLLCMPLVLQGCAGPSSTGTATRPLLTAQEAAPYTTENYFAQGGLFSQPQGAWQPSEITLTHIETPWRVAPKGAPYTGVQQAVDAALAHHKGNERLYIRLEPGVYTGTVYIPDDAPPMTLFGTGKGHGRDRHQLRRGILVAKSRSPTGQFNHCQQPARHG